MGTYSIRADETALAALATRAEAGEEIVLSREGHIVAKIIPFPAPENLLGPADRQAHSASTTAPAEEDLPVLRVGGQNFLGLAGTDLSWLDAPLHEEEQRAFGMID